MITLGIDSASPQLSLAILENDIILSEIQFSETQRHSEKILDLLDEVLIKSNKQKNDLNLIAVDIGPGPFTSVRIGVSTARALSQFLDIDIMAVSSLEILYSMFIENTELDTNIIYAPILDARKNKIFTALYKNGQILKEEMDIAPLELCEMLNQFNEKKLIFGSGLKNYSNLLSENIKNLDIIEDDKYHYPGASICAKLAVKNYNNRDNFNYNTIKPNYIRRSDAEISLENKKIIKTRGSMVKRALISVSDKAGIIDLAKSLKELNVEMVSTGGTFKTIFDSGLEVTQIEDFTGFPEIMGGRVKTLHPKIHGGILSLRDNKSHISDMEKQDIQAIDMVVVNLYPFQEVIQKKDVSNQEVIENIDIGGVALLRASAKNFKHVMVLTDPEDYKAAINAIKNGENSIEFRYELALKAFKMTSEYDSSIFNYLNINNCF